MSDLINISILLIEDDEDDYFLVRRHLGSAKSIATQLTWENDLEAAQMALVSNAYDVYLVDYRLGSKTGLELISQARKKGCISPIILLTGQDEDTLEGKAIRYGIDDYIKKSELNSYLLERSIRHVIEQKQREFEVIIEQNARQAAEIGEETFRHIADNAPVLIWIAGLDKKCSWFNKQWLSFTGRPIEEEIGDGWIKNIHPDDAESCLQTFTHSFDSKSEFEMEYRLLHHSGEYRWVLDKGQPRYDTNGMFVGFIGSCIDIHDRKISQEKLEKSEAKHRTLFETMSQGVVYHDASGAIISANPAAEKILGLSLAQLQGRLSFDRRWKSIKEDGSVFPGTEHPAMVALRTGKKVKYVIMGVYNPQREEYRWINITAIPMFNENQELPYQVYATFEDITERKKLDERKDEFLGIASHELRTPLTSIKGYVQIAMRNLENNEYQKLQTNIGKTQRYVDRLNDLIAELLDVSRIQSGKLKLNKSEFLLKDLIQDSVESIQSTSTTHTIKVVNDIEVSLKADKDRLEQVLTNLLSNAIKYSPKADTVILETKRAANEVIISVTDFGLGIPPDKLDHVFERFYRVEETAKNISGLGIGLFIAHEIINRHSGRMWVESTLNKGSVFYVALPIT